LLFDRKRKREADLEDYSKPISSYEMPRASNERAGPMEVVLNIPQVIYLASIRDSAKKRRAKARGRTRGDGPAADADLPH
jgi:hypothetical protein